MVDLYRSVRSRRVDPPSGSRSLACFAVFLAARGNGKPRRTIRNTDLKICKRSNANQHSLRLKRHIKCKSISLLCFVHRNVLLGFQLARSIKSIERRGARLDSQQEIEPMRKNESYYRGGMCVYFACLFLSFSPHSLTFSHTRIRCNMCTRTWTRLRDGTNDGTDAVYA